MYITTSLYQHALQVTVKLNYSRQTYRARIHSTCFGRNKPQLEEQSHQNIYTNLNKLFQHNAQPNGRANNTIVKSSTVVFNVNLDSSKHT